MPRYLLTIEYDGTPYVGWQRQINGPSVQTEVEEAIQDFCQQDVRLHVAGRTDTGVHAFGQCAHFDSNKQLETDTIRTALSHYLRDKQISIVSAQKVADDFHARFSAKKRSYVYKILNRVPTSPLYKDRVWHIRKPLDLAAMREAANHLLGKHDFTSFRSSECQADSPIRTIDILDIKTEGEMILIHVEAQSFLHHMVRNLTGTLVHVGQGKWAPADVKRILDAKDRKQAGPTAPSAGLYFVKVEY